MKKYITKVVSILLLAVVFSCSEDTIDLEGVGSITGTVVRVGTNEPLENVKISTNPATSTVFTNDVGVYIIENVPSGEYSLSAEREDLLTVFEGVSVLVDSELEVVLEMDVSTANNRPPTVVSLVTPADNSTDVPVDVEFVWTASDPEDDDLYYTLTLRNDEDTNVEVFENITDTTYTISELSYGVKYFWQVSATDSINDPINSTTNAFQTIFPPNNRLVFSRIEDGNSIIYSADEDGNTELQLTSSSKNSFRPRRNSTTGKIAFLQSVGSQTHVFIMNEDGSQVEQVTSTVGVSGFNLEEVDFSWDADGAKILFPNQNKLYTINVDGSGLDLLYQTTGDLITEVDKNEDTGVIVLKTNNLDGYGVQIFTIDESGTVLDVVLTGENGAAGSINLSVDGTQLLYSRDVSGSETANYRQLDSRMFLYNFGDMTNTDLSVDKTSGTNDLDARFSPNEASVIFVNTSNDGISERSVQKLSISDIEVRTILLENASMPDWE
ncbi:carboxypeptidase regulatory-like domain-containing protein [Aquimarina pacifica]|uniref:carboxypeptidase regulatory-like domain-containing protein n=1 Tax=Aquimarina pacifica TaxID=1296415 RepID=UPI0004719D80|nr:carboxypeptidase regulatory-like domain-containing protein [Aquimarina pacifica]